MAKRDTIKSSPFENWHIYCSRYVAIFDVCSLINYKNPVGVTPVDIYKKLEKLAESAENILHMRGSNGGIIHEKHMSGNLKYVTFLDKVALVTNDGSSESYTLIQLASMALFCNAFMLGFPVRGAIVKGEAFVGVENQICLGEAFKSASVLLTQQEWLGVLIDQSVKCDELEATREISDDEVPLTIYTTLPGKQNEIVSDEIRQVLNWSAFIGPKTNALKLVNNIQNTLGLESTSIYYNTVRYINKQFD